MPTTNTYTVANAHEICCELSEHTERIWMHESKKDMPARNIYIPQTQTIANSSFISLFGGAGGIHTQHIHKNSDKYTQIYMCTLEGIEPKPSG